MDLLMRFALGDGFGDDAIPTPCRLFTLCTFFIGLKGQNGVASKSLIFENIILRYNFLDGLTCTNSTEYTIHILYKITDIQLEKKRRFQLSVLGQTICWSFTYSNRKLCLS